MTAADVRSAIVVVMLTASAACHQAQAPAKPTADAAPTPDGAALDAASSDTGDAASSDEPAAERAKRWALTNGKFPVALFGPTGGPVRALAQDLPLALLPREQRGAEPAADAGAACDGDDPRGKPPFLQVGITRDPASAGAKRARVLVLMDNCPHPPMAVEPEADSDSDDAVAAAVLSFRPIGPARPLGVPSGTGANRPRAWSRWRWQAPQWDAELLVLENKDGAPVAIRFFDALLDESPLSIDPNVPMFLSTSLDNASGVDDDVTLDVVAWLDGELRVVLAVDAGPRSEMMDAKGAPAVLGPLGSVAIDRQDSKPVLRVRRVTSGAGLPCTPGGASESGCPGEEAVYTWDAATHAFTSGPVTRITLQAAPGKPVTIKPR